MAQPTARTHSHTGRIMLLLPPALIQDAKALKASAFISAATCPGIIAVIFPSAGCAALFASYAREAPHALLVSGAFCRGATAFITLYPAGMGG
ncbi:MAG: hypothetical protein GY753_16975 [Gammaproteobacteria bacterium]|nr:hypothetical protein [Gammaproteobacteria bacterium]